MNISPTPKFLIGRLRIVVCRLRLLQAEVEEVGAVLKSGRISPAGALHWLRENDVLELCLTDRELEDVACRS